MRRMIGTAVLLVCGVVFGMAWTAGCDRDNDAGAKTPQAPTPAAVLLGLVGTPGAGSSVWSIHGGGSGSEEGGSFPMPRAGTLRNLHVKASAVQGAATITVVVRVNSADSVLQLDYGNADGTGVKANTAASVSVAQGDLVTVEFRNSTGTGGSGIMKASVLFE